MTMNETLSEPTAAAAAAAAAAATELATTTTTKQRKRLGKCARRRNQKARAIHEASSSTTTSFSSCSGDGVPFDRGYILEGVKVRRREWKAQLEQEGWYHKRYDQDALLSLPTTSTVAIDDNIERDDVPLHPDDENALLSQLGYIPGNAICVAARISSSIYETTALSSASTIHDSYFETTHKQSSLPLPLVVKLYPLAARQKYEGGKSDGRAFKGRRRGAMRLEVDDNVHNDVDTKADKYQQQKLLPPIGKSEIQNDNIIIEPFPTLYWLTHPQLHSRISKLELSTEYNVSKMEERLRSSPAYLQQMERAHLSYGRKRWELLTLDDRDYVMQRGWKSALDDNRGVAGIRLYKDDDGNDGNCNSEDEQQDRGGGDDDDDAKKTTTTTKKKMDGHQRSKGYDCVKCLHAHVAHYLAQMSEWEEGLRKEEGVEGQEEAAAEEENDEAGDGCGCVDEAAKSRSSHSTAPHLTQATSTAILATKSTTKKDCDWDDLNLIGKWVMEVVNSFG